MNLLDILFPKTCFGCGKEGRYICGMCIGKVRSPKPVCPECLRASIDGMTHSKCLRPWGLNGLISLWNYEGVVRKAILALKFKFAGEVAKELSKYATPHLLTRSDLVRDAVMVPIPLYWYKKNFRGFNQSEEIGRAIAEKMSWKFDPELLIRKEARAPQTELKKKRRLQNIRGVFEINSSYALSSMHSSLILFDDVWTTGSTLKEAAKELKRAGYERVWGLTLARGIS